MRYGRGFVHPEGKENDFEGLHLTKKEIVEFSDSISDTPLYTEHDTKNPIGRVTKGFVDKETGKLGIEFEFEEDKISGNLRENIEYFGKIGLSLGMVNIVKYDKNKYPRVVQKTIHDVSIVEKPAYESTYVTHLSKKINNNDNNKNEFIQQKNKKIIQEKTKDYSYKDLFNDKESRLFEDQKMLNEQQPTLYPTSNTEDFVFMKKQLDNYKMRITETEEQNKKMSEKLQIYEQKIPNIEEYDKNLKELQEIKKKKEEEEKEQMRRKQEENKRILSQLIFDITQRVKDEGYPAEKKDIIINQLQDLIKDGNDVPPEYVTLISVAHSLNDGTVTRYESILKRQREESQQIENQKKELETKYEFYKDEALQARDSRYKLQKTDEISNVFQKNYTEQNEPTRLDDKSCNTPIKNIFFDNKLTPEIKDIWDQFK